MSFLTHIIKFLASVKKTTKGESNKAIQFVSGNLKLQIISGWLQVGVARITKQHKEIKRKNEGERWKRSKH
ncbi:CLUMA_CG020596, isoform A [Clunio marinus]|uniref:CLUMA_CG020596, isoform A n=1 Tax=Clunio marinus TaxID=568069 RepID=A0A1J1J5F2_9DIPT|nr:CLUMA_CG020596, isoform A [Clunio marinus]